MSHKAGFVNIIGNPNVGKSTLMNKLVGEKLSIITSKAQTTRHRILGIVNGEDFQIIYSDTPGVIKPAYKLQESMMSFVSTALSDADVILFVTDLFEKYFNDKALLEKVRKTKKPVLLLINKIDLAKENQLDEQVDNWKELLPDAEIIPISALLTFNVDTVFKRIIELLPEGNPYYPKDELTDKPERFFVTEIVREKIFTTYKKEVPYATEVIATSFKEEEKIIRIAVEIIVERATQKGIIIGHKGEKLKKVGTEARKDLEQFFGKKIFLEMFVKVEKDWRKKDKLLKRFGYNK